MSCLATLVGTRSRAGQGPIPAAAARAPTRMKMTPRAPSPKKVGRHRVVGRGLASSALLHALIHRSAWKRNSPKFISTILNIRPYRAGAVQHLAAPMDRMLPQHVGGLDRNSLW